MLRYCISQGQLNPIVLGLLRVNEYRFVHVLQQEIVEAIKNLLRQVRFPIIAFYFYVSTEFSMNMALKVTSNQVIRRQFTIIQNILGWECNGICCMLHFYENR